MVDSMIRPTDIHNGPIQEYFLGHLLRFEGEHLLSNLRGVDCRVGFEIDTDQGSLRHVLVLNDGAIQSVQEDWEDRPEIVYRTNDETFYRVVGGWQRAESAFLRGRIKIRGNILRGLKLAFLLQEFFDRFPYRPSNLPHYEDPKEAADREIELFPEDLIEERIQVSNDLSIKAVYREDGAPTTAIVLVPPHPFLGGTSDNRLLLRLASDLAVADAFVVRFDYRHPARDSDRSILSFWEQSDAGQRMGVDEVIEIHHWMLNQEFIDGSPLQWIGYSYGAQVCLWAMEELAPDRLALVSPVVAQIGEERFNCEQDALVVGGSEDFATTPTEFQLFSDSLRVAPRTRMIEDADHFYTRKEEELMKTLHGYLGDRRLGWPTCDERGRK